MHSTLIWWQAKTMATRRQVRRAIELHEDDLSKHPNVVGIGAHWDTKKKAKGAERDHAVVLYVTSASDLSGGKPGADQLPTTIEIPARRGVHRIPVMTREIGEIHPETTAPAASATEDEFFAG